MQPKLSAQTLSSTILIILFCLVGYFSVRIVGPFLLSVIMAGIFAITLHPLYKKLYYRIGQKQIAAVLTLLLFIGVIGVPLFFLGSLFFAEIQTLVANASHTSVNQSFFGPLEDAVFRITNGRVVLDTYIENGITNGLQSIFAFTGKIFSSIATVLLQTLIFLFALFYTLVHGARIKKYIVETIPLKETLIERLFDKTVLFVGGVMKELFFLSVFRLIVLLALFAVFGVPNMILWAVIGMIVSIIPGIGIIFTIIPVALFVGGIHGVAIGVLFFTIGLVCAIFVENILGPYLVRGNFNMHPFLILLSMLGGMLLFGIPGFFIGPIIVGMFFVLIEEIRYSQKEIHIIQ